jgi:uncharacterized membrane protein required for colicin V production
VRYDETVAQWIGATGPPAAGPDLMRLAAAAGIFIGVVVAMGVLAWLVTRVLSAVKLRIVDRMAGAGVGLLMAILFVCAATIPLVAYWSPDATAWAGGSVLAPYAVAGGGYLLPIVPDPMKARFIERSRPLIEGPRDEANRPDPGR